MTAGRATRCFRFIAVRPLPGRPGRGVIAAGGLRIACVLGRAGIVAMKREGDGGTPRARLRPLAIYWRADRLRPPATSLPATRIGRDLGWCDAPAHRLYNRPVRRPFAASHEEMWRADSLYDLVVDLDWNRSPARKGRGSAIFMHAARPDRTPTAGCIALAPPVLRRLIARIGRGTVFRVG